MQISAVLLRWYKSFNTLTLGPGDPDPVEPWNMYKGQSFPFVRVPVDRRVTCIVGANESGKSHLLSAIAKVIHGNGLPGASPDEYEIKDICRYCGFDAFDGVFPEIGVELLANAAEAAALAGDNEPSPVTKDSAPVTMTVVLNGGDDENYATIHRGDLVVRRLNREAWRDTADELLPRVEFLDSSLALPNDVHIDELIDTYRDQTPKAVVDPLRVQDAWRELETADIDETPDPNVTRQKLVALRKALKKHTRTTKTSELPLVYQLFSDVLGLSVGDLERMRQYTNSERGFVSRMNDQINVRLDRALDIARYWGQDDDFRLTVNYKAGTFHFQITDRTGATYTFNERSSGLRYFLSYYIQARALERAARTDGAVILMDEPDNYLSAAGQRSLLQVFESLVSAKTSAGNCQLVYTTHSPFLINRNFPSRIQLVRKGEATEGTQHVARPAVRRFEPVRSALSIDAADTLFLGSVNVIVEGAADQKMLTACIQRFGEPGRLEEWLDMNACTLVASNGAPFAVRLAEKALKGDERPPIVVAMLDGDPPGAKAQSQLVKLLGPKLACTLSEVAVGTRVFQVLEDLVPAPLCDRALQSLAARHSVSALPQFDDAGPGDNRAKRLVEFCRGVGGQFAGMSDDEIRSGVVDEVVNLIEDETFHMAELSELKENMAAVCRQLNVMIGEATRAANQRSLKSILSQKIVAIGKRLPSAASKGDVVTLLDDMTAVVFGSADDFERTRRNLRRLREQLDAEAKENADMVDWPKWRMLLERFKNHPWVASGEWLVSDRTKQLGSKPTADADQPTVPSAPPVH